MKNFWRSGSELVGGYLRTTDRLLWACCLALSGISTLLLLGLLHTGYLSTRMAIVTQLGAWALGILTAVLISSLDYHALAGMWKVYLPATLFLTLLTFTPLGITRGNDRAWLPTPIENFTIQPAEFLKLAFVYSFALHLQRVKEDVNKLPTLALLCLHGAVPVLLIHFQGDDGTALVFVCIFVAMLFSAGLSLKYVIGAGAAAAAVAPLVWFFMLTEDQKNRILIFSNPAADATGSGWQQFQGLMAIGSGQMVGTGLFSGEHIYVGEARNDFIFTFLGESWGFLGCLALIALLLFMTCKILHNAVRAADDLGRFICIGIFAMMAFQIVVNLGMCLSLLPVIGITLPFLSSGGTSVLTVYLAIGMVLGVHKGSRTNMFTDD